MNLVEDITAVLPELDDEGYLTDPADWNEQVAVALADSENLLLNDEYWDVLLFMRAFYEEHQIAPDARYVIKHLAERWGGGARKKLFELFPYGYVKQACKIAGMRRPRAWSTG